NVFRAGGKGAFTLTLIADGLKGFIPVMAGILLGLGDNEIALASIGLAAVIGHNWPLYLGFKGGKGVATSGGVLLALAPVALVLALVTWFLIIRLTPAVRSHWWVAHPTSRRSRATACAWSWPARSAANPSERLGQPSPMPVVHSITSS